MGPIESGVGLTAVEVNQEKAWVKLTADEKIERLRKIIKQKDYQFRELYEVQKQVRKLRQLLVKHSHNGGEVVSKVEEYDVSSGQGLLGTLTSQKENPDEVYF